MPLVHQQQPTPYTCNQACLAMLLDAPVGKVVELFPSPGMNQRELMAALDTLRFQWDAMLFSRLLVEGYYIVTVPSLNFEGGAHTVVLEHAGDRIHVYDPNKGRDGKKFYSDDGDGGVSVSFWTDAILVLPGGKLPEFL